jgi:hypothetical protein
VELVKDGQPVAEIVVATNALSGVRLAAEDLQRHLEMMSGAKLPLVGAPTDSAGYHVYVGESEHTRKLGFALGAFTSSGFRIVAKGQHLILAGIDIQRAASAFSSSGEGLKKWQEFCGEPFGFGAGGDIGIGHYNQSLKLWTNDDLGTWSAVAELLEQLGVRWYMPYENGTVIPETKTIVVADQDLRREAAFARREFCFYNAMRGDPEGVSWFKRLKLGNNNVIIFNHTTYDIYSSPEQQKRHPEYLACDADGKPYSGYPAGRGMPRYSDPGFRKAAVIYMNKTFEAIPALKALAIGPPDGGLKLDARDIDRYGKPTDSLTQKASQYVWDFHLYLAGELKKSHPDKYLLYMTGGGANEVPGNITEFPPNLLMPFAQPYSAYMVVNSTARATLEDRRRWLSHMPVLKKGPIWDYYLYYSSVERPRVPVVFTDYLQREMLENESYSDGKFIEIQPAEYRVTGEKYPRYRLKLPGLMHLMVYWQSRLFWDPKQDRQAFLDEYYRLFFGPASAEMKEFYDFAEQIWTRQASRSVTPTTGFLKEGDVGRYFDILTKAREKAGRESVYEKRIAAIEGEMESLRKLFESLKRTGPAFEACRTPAPFTLDGDLAKYGEQGRVALRDNTTGELPATNATLATLALTPDDSALIVGVVCYENSMDKLKADCRLNDTFSLFDDDVVEVYVNTPERSYFKVAVNPNGTLWDESLDATIVDRDTLPILWNPGTKAVVRKFADRWTVEIMIPTKDFGAQAPTRTQPWGIQVARTRFTGGTAAAWAIAPTAGPYARLNRWGDLYVK